MYAITETNLGFVFPIFQRLFFRFLIEALIRWLRRLFEICREWFRGEPEFAEPQFVFATANTGVHRQAGGYDDPSLQWTRGQSEWGTSFPS